MDAELKSLLTVLIDKVERIEATMATKAELAELRATMATKAEVAEIRAIMATKDDIAELRAATKDDIARLGRELTLTRQVVGSNHLILTGRIDQLTQQYGMLTGFRPSAE